VSDLIVTRKASVADGVLSLVLADPDGGALPAWEPGAHIDVALPGGLTRQYSLCGDPADRRTWRLGVLREADSRGGSRHLHDSLAEGETIRVGGPRNNFPLVEAARYLFIAGGVGITPILPMLAAADATGAEWRLVYGGRTRGSMAFQEDLERYGDRICIRPQDETGLLDLAALLGEPTPDTLVYCCGPEPLLAAVEERCRAWPPGSLHVERFRPKPEASPTPNDCFEVALAGTGLTLTVPPDRSVLEAVEAAGVQVLNSCREGTCGTCETPVLEGIPDHRDGLLTDEEQAAADTMLICVSRSRTPRLVLDL
jgi:ferredoxin-NADP reductase